MSSRYSKFGKNRAEEVDVYSGAQCRRAAGSTVLQRNQHQKTAVCWDACLKQIQQDSVITDLAAIAAMHPAA